MSASQYTAQLASGAYARGVFGQSYQIAGQNEYDTDFYRSAGLATDDSDFVSGLYVQASSYLGFSAQSRFDHDTFDVKRTDLSTSAHYGPGQVQVNYADVTSEPGLALGQPREEILAAGVLAITDTWALARQHALRSRDRSDHHRRSWAAVPGRLLDRERHLSAVLHPRPGHQTRRALSVELCAEISRHLFQFATQADYATRSAPSGSDTNH